MAAVDFYQDIQKSQLVVDKADKARLELAALFERWEELESLDT